MFHFTCLKATELHDFLADMNPYKDELRRKSCVVFNCLVCVYVLAVVQVYVVVGIAAVAFTGFLLMLVILKFGGNSKFGIKGKTKFWVKVVPSTTKHST